MFEGMGHRGTQGEGHENEKHHALPFQSVPLFSSSAGVLASR